MAERSLAAQSGALKQPLELPEVFSVPQEPMKARFLAPYLVFAHPKRADEWNRIVAETGPAQEGQMYLIHPDYVVALPTAKLGWLCGRQHWALVAGTGEASRTSLTEKPRPYREIIDAVVLVYFDEGIIPANVMFRSTKCPAAKVLSDALILASTPEWAEKSPAHKETLVCVQPFMRFYGIVELAPPRTSRQSGLPYRIAQCTIKPTGMAEWRLLAEFAKGEDTQKQLQDAAARFTQRMKEVQELLEK